jgi:hypothetical protein
VKPLGLRSLLPPSSLPAGAHITYRRLPITRCLSSVADRLFSVIHHRSLALPKGSGGEG